MFTKLGRTAGFTLIELLVTISIMLLITGGGIAGFMSFNDRQQVQTTVKEIQSYMRSAQVKARAGEGADDCNAANGKLKGYKVELNGAGTAVLLERVCLNPETGVETVTERSRFNLSNVTVTSSPVTFLALKGGVDTGNVDVTITVTGQYVSSIVYSFQVLRTGEITEGSFQ